MSDRFTLNIGEIDFSDLIEPLAVGASTDRYPETILPIPLDAPKVTGDPYESLKSSILNKSTSTQASTAFCRFALQELDVKVELAKADYGLKEGENKLWGKGVFESWPQENGATTATPEQNKALLGVIALASRCRARPGPDRSDYLETLWQRGILLVDQELVAQLNLREYQPEVIASLVTNFISATLAFLYISTGGLKPMMYPESFQFGVLAIQGVSNSLLSHWLRVGQIFDVGPSIVTATVPFREIRQLCGKILEKSADLGDTGPQITLFLQALGRNFTGFSIRASPFTASLLTMILLFATDARTLLYLYAGAGADAVVEMARRAYLWTTGFRAVQGQFAQVTVGGDVIRPIIHTAQEQQGKEPKTHTIESCERQDPVKYLLWLMTHYVDLLDHGVQLPDSRVVNQETYLISIREPLQLDPAARPFPDSSLGRILSRRYKPQDISGPGAPHRDTGAPRLGRVAGHAPQVLAHPPQEPQEEQAPGDSRQEDLLNLE